MSRCQPSALSSSSVTSVRLSGVCSDFHAHHLGGVQQPAVVVQRAEDVHLLLLVVPVAAQSPEDGCPVVEGVGGHADLGVFERDDLTLKIGVPWEIHEHLRVRNGWKRYGYYTRRDFTNLGMVPNDRPPPSLTQIRILVWGLHRSFLLWIWERWPEIIYGLSLIIE